MSSSRTARVAACSQQRQVTCLRVSSIRYYVHTDSEAMGLTYREETDEDPRMKYSASRKYGRNRRCEVEMCRSHTAQSSKRTWRRGRQKLLGQYVRVLSSFGASTSWTGLHHSARVDRLGRGSQPPTTTSLRNRAIPSTSIPSAVVQAFDALSNFEIE